MLRLILLALVGTCTAQPQQYAVGIQYNDPQITLTVHVSGNDVTDVVFHYGVRVTSHQGRGTRSAGGWEFHGQLQTNPGDSITAYAIVHFSSGLTLTSPQASHHVGGRAAAIAPLGERRVRAVLFRDDFNSYNHNNWSPEVSMFGGMNWEFQVYTPETKNIYASNGNLYLRPTLTADDSRWNENFLHTGKMDVAQIWGYCTNDGNYGCVREGQNGLLPPVMSGKVSSNPTIRFGTVEVRAKIPRGDWLWPAIWMMPKSSVYGGWPRSGEIDIMESRGNGGDIGVGTVSSTLHWGTAWDQNRYSLTHGEKHSGDYHAAFHTWRLDWNQDHLKTFVDNQQVMDVEVGSGFWAKGGFSGSNIWGGGSKAAPFDQDFFLMLNVAVGGTNGFFPDNANWGGARKPWANTSPHAAGDFWDGRNSWLPTWSGDNAALQVDYVEFRN